jgi:8-oxo-dGTP pyrophosphatase MutT (NUDIX family)
MAYVGPGRYVVVVLHVGGTKLSNVKLVLRREPRAGKTWFPAGSVAANEELVDAAVRELREETGLTLTPDDLTLLSDAHVRVALPDGQQLVSFTRLLFPFRTLRTTYVLLLSSSRLLHPIRRLIRMVLTSYRKHLISVV